MRSRCICAALLLTAAAGAQPRNLKPGWNLFSPQQDVQVGREASAEIQSKLRIVHNPDLNAYIDRLGHILMRSPHAGAWPYTFHVVYDKNINAFSLPGGPIYVNTGAIEACDNEAQLAGVMAHEMSHIELRHATNQISKAKAVELPALLLGALTGNGILGTLTRAGIGLTANSVLLKFSRSAEAEADYNGVEIMADAGFNPLELANFFEKLEKQSGNSRVMQFLSDHPNPGDRVQSIHDEVRQIPRRPYAEDQTGRFAAMKALTLQLAPPAKQRGVVSQPGVDFRDYRGQGFQFS